MELRPIFFENGLLRASGNRSLNDPFEARPSIRYFKSLAKKTGWDRFNVSEDDLEKYIAGQPLGSPWRTLGLDRFDAFGVICFTTKPDHLLMWSHYADQHRGMVIEFDSSHAFFNSQFSHEGLIKSGKLSKVSYKKGRLAKFHGFDDPFFEKSHHWKHEDEWRLVVPFSQCLKRLVSLDDLDHLRQIKAIENESIEPFDDSLVNIANCSFRGGLPKHPEIMFMCEIPPDAIKGVTFGALACEDGIRRSTDIIRGRPEIRHLNLLKSRISLRKYAVESDPL